MWDLFCLPLLFAALYEILEVGPVAIGHRHRIIAGYLALWDGD